MPISNLGYRPINKLETAADYKQLNDTLRALWIKILGNLGSKDVNGEIAQELTGEFGTRFEALAGRMSGVEQMNSAQNGRLNVLEGDRDAAAEALEALEEMAIAQGESITALEEQAAALTERITALEEWQQSTTDQLAAIAEWRTATDKHLARIDARLKALDGLEE